MSGSNPIVKCFAILCFGAALLLVVFEWRDPFDLKSMAASTSVTQPVGGQLPSSAQRRSLMDWLVRRASAPQSSMRVVVKLGRRRVELYRDKTLLKEYSVAIGQDDWETPTGTFTVTQMQKNPAWEHPITREVIPAGDENPLGTRWIGFWQNETAQIGFHGTNQADLIGQAVSHGCIRMVNQDIQTLYEYLEIGTVVEVIP